MKGFDVFCVGSVVDKWVEIQSYPKAQTIRWWTYPLYQPLKFPILIRCGTIHHTGYLNILVQSMHSLYDIECLPDRMLINFIQVILYRSGLVTAAVSFVIAASSAFLPEGFIVGDVIKRDLDLLYIIGAGGLGLSLYLIHIYVTPIKQFLQALWALGVIGSIGTYLVLAQPLDESLVQYVVDNPVSLWFVGPLFAALTGLVFKEGLCYGKLEAGFLTFIIPGLLLGHLTSIMDNGTKLSLLGVWMALFVVFATRKFQQPIKDDIGDKSVFVFNALPEEEKKALLQKLEQQPDQKLD